MQMGAGKVCIEDARALFLLLNFQERLHFWALIAKDNARLIYRALQSAERGELPHILQSLFCNDLIIIAVGKIN